MPQIYPIVVDVPTIVGNGLRRVSMGSELRLFEVSGNLWAITGGTHTIRVRRALDQSVLGQISWTTAGVQIFTGIDEYVADDDGLLFDCTALGTGAQVCTITLWGFVPNTPP